MHLYGQIAKIYRSTPHFTLLLAGLIVLTRLIIFDAPAFLALAHVPNHDMYQGASFFATNLHSMRLTGDLAWWNSATGLGYAQYSQFFISPMAPTANNIVFIIWMQVSSVFARVGVVIPEYFQYLLINYVVFPGLAFWAFANFVSLLFKHHLTVLIITIIFAFSGIGFWYGTWLYFQEPFLLFFFLYGFVKLLQRPNSRSMLLFLIATLIQAVSINYWTLYNSWFIAIFIIAYVIAYPTQVKRVGSHFWRISKENKLLVTCLAVGVLAVLGLWGLITASILSELNLYSRTDGPFSINNAYIRIFDFSNALSEVFSPFIISDKVGENSAHLSRYIGLLVLPLGVAVFSYRWRRLERFWFLLMVMVFTVVLAPPMLLRAWEFIPSMNSIRHFFYFYQQYVQLSLVILAGFGLDYILRPQAEILKNLQLKYIFVGSSLLGLSVVIYVNLFLNAPDLQRDYQITLFGWLLLIYSLLCYLFITQVRMRGILSVAFVILTYQDLTRYFFEVSRSDVSFTTHTRYEELRQPYEIYRHEIPFLLKPWDTPNQDSGFHGGIAANLPLPNDMWPVNRYIVPNRPRNLSGQPELLNQAMEGSALQFFSPENTKQVTLQDLLTETYNSRELSETLLVEGDSDQLVAENKAHISTTSSGSGDFAFQWLNWSYNEHTIQLEMPQEGWVLMRQLHAPSWEIRVDDVPVEFTTAYGMDMATYLPAGSHRMTLNFMPPARRLYWVAVVSFEVLLVILVGLFIYQGKNKAVRTNL